ncbi:FAD-linked oxidase C-terminal domain-containing protein, partial [Paenibacillus sp. GYB003]|uniref:FAD-linked oxidase C-terminal domain-containing protein n=1 Tax=Paenibacillus sp. GYB003 TaxID=2994392 RepID=UPI002F96C1F5
MYRTRTRSLAIAPDSGSLNRRKAGPAYPKASRLLPCCADFTLRRSRMSSTCETFSKLSAKFHVRLSIAGYDANISLLNIDSKRKAERTMKRLRTWVAGTMTLALTLGGGVWAHHYVQAAPTGDNSQPQAQTQTDGQIGKQGKRAMPEQGDRFRGFHIGPGFAVTGELAALLGTTKDELAQAIKGGKTIAAIAAEKNVSVDSVVGLLVKAPLEKLDKQLADGKLAQEQYDKAKAALTDRATKFVNGESGGKAGLPFGKLDFKDRGGAHFEFRLAVTGELAALLGTTKDELAQAIKGGKTIAAIAAEK